MSLEYCKKAPNDPVHASYHDKEYGFPVTDESALFERLTLEIMQAGLSWGIVLKKRQALNEAFDRFDPIKVAAFSAVDINRLMNDGTIIRNRRKIIATIENAAIIVNMRTYNGSFAGWLAAHHPRTKVEWIKLFKKTFVFTGPEITSEFLMSIGYLRGAHTPSCPVFNAIARKTPPWATKTDPCR